MENTYKQDIINNYNMIFNLISTNTKYSDFITSNHSEHREHNSLCRTCDIEIVEKNLKNALNIF